MFEIPREYILTAESKISTVIQMHILKQINTAKTLKIQNISIIYTVITSLQKQITLIFILWLNNL